MEIYENQVLEMKNVLSYRGEMMHQEMILKSQEIEEVIKVAGAEKTGKAVTTTYAVKQTEKGQVVDMEILIPLNKEVTAPAGYRFNERFYIVNALKACHKGNPALIQNTVNQLNEYIVSNGLTPITTGYNVTVKDAANPAELDLVEVDIYVGISPNRL